MTSLDLTETLTTKITKVTKSNVFGPLSLASPKPIDYAAVPSEDLKPQSSFPLRDLRDLGGEAFRGSRLVAAGGSLGARRLRQSIEAQPNHGLRELVPGHLMSRYVDLLYGAAGQLGPYRRAVAQPAREICPQRTTPLIGERCASGTDVQVGVRAARQPVALEWV